MSTLHHNFNDIAGRKPEVEADAPKYPSPFSIRFTFEERARLDAERGRSSLAVHIRERLFEDEVTPRRKPGNSPVKDVDACTAKATGDVFENLPQRKRATYKEVFDLIYDCSVKQVAAKSLIDRMLDRLSRSWLADPGLYAKQYKRNLYRLAYKAKIYASLYIAKLYGIAYVHT